MELELLLLTAALGKGKEQCFGSIFHWFYPIPRHNNLIFVFNYFTILKVSLTIAVITRNSGYTYNTYLRQNKKSDCTFVYGKSNYPGYNCKTSTIIKKDSLC